VCQRLARNARSNTSCRAVVILRRQLWPLLNPRECSTGIVAGSYRSPVDESAAPAKSTLPLVLLILALFLSGFINLGPSIIGGYPATLLIDALIIFMVWNFVVFFARPDRHQIFEPWMLALCASTILLITLVLFGHEKLGLRLSAFRTMCLYPMVAIYTVIFVRKLSQIDRIERLVMRMFVLVAAFACFQFVFRNQLPIWLLVSKDTYAMGYIGTDIVRATALMGHAVVFGTALSLGYSLHLARLTGHPTFSRFLCAGVIFAGTLATFSRVLIAVNCVLTVVIPIVAWFRRRPSEAMVGCVALLLAALTTIGTLSAAGVSLDLGQSFIAGQIFGAQNKSALYSMDAHREQFQIFHDTFPNNLWTGLGISTQNVASLYSESHTVVNDGGILSLLMEGGLLIGVPYLGMLFLVTGSALNTARKNRRNWQAFGFAVFALSQFLFADIVNPGLWGKGPFLLFWIMFGLICARRQVEQVEAVPTPSGDVSARADLVRQS
jgi:hypothetical protein